MNTQCTQYMKDLTIIGNIADRAIGMKITPHNWVKLDVAMSLCVAHESTPLRLADLLAADAMNFTHDVAGIIRHIDVDASTIDPTFLPRFAASTVTH